MTKILPDGSYRSCLYPSTKDREMKTNGIEVRVIEYRMPVVRCDEPFYRLVTTILDHKNGTTAELAALYKERWQIETAYHELKTHLRGGADVVLRSKTPDLVKQEFYGLMLAYFSVRAIMHEAPVSSDDDQVRLSFVHAVRVIKRRLPQLAADSPRRRPELHKAIIAGILQERVVVRITGTNQRGIRRKSSHPVTHRSKDRKLIMTACNFMKILKPEKQEKCVQIVT